MTYTITIPPGIAGIGAITLFENLLESIGYEGDTYQLVDGTRHLRTHNGIELIRED